MPLIDTWPDPPAVATTIRGLRCVYDILPANYDLLIREMVDPRLLVDDVEVRIREGAQISESEQDVGMILTVTLVDPSDAALFNNSVSINFGVGRHLSDGTWDEETFEPILEGAVYQSMSSTTEGAPNDPKDRIDIKIITKAGDRLTKTSERGLIIYDSNRTEISDADIKPIYDTDGNPYTPEVMAIPGLTLANLRQEILVNRCGFDFVHTDIEDDDYPVLRYQVKLGQRLYDGLKTFLGMFRPAITPFGNNGLWIKDTTSVQPSDFPLPRLLNPDRALSVRIGSERRRLDAINLIYTGLENNYDYTTFRFEYPEDSDPSQRVEWEKIWIEFRKITSPTTNVIVREALNIENRRIFDSDDNETDNSSKAFEFDSKARVNHIKTKILKLLPTISDVTQPDSLQNAREELDEYIWAADPFAPRKDYIARRSLRVDGLLAIDEANPLPNGDPAIQDLLTARHSLNINEDQTFEFGPIKRREETAEPQRDGTVRVRVWERNEITGIVDPDYTEDRAGEISVSGASTSVDERLVFAEDGLERSTDSVEDMNIRELPLKYGISLARRIIRQTQADDGETTIPMAGYDKTLQKGFPITAPNRDGDGLGTFVITGRQIQFRRLGVIMNLAGRVMASSNQPLQEVERYGDAITPGVPLVYRLPVQCTEGYSIFLAPSPVPNMTIEARHVEMPELPWTDLETDSISLTAWDGTVQPFEFRYTADVVTEITRVEFFIGIDFTNAP